tara:strand:- start:2018 stop:3205 length:1188 start_codon:yes stop_codon:yes gene_type:complete
MNFNYLVKDWAWRVNDGMPDPKNRKHLQLLEDVLRANKYSEEFITSYIDSILEANLAGRTTNYKQPTGAFYKYVEMNPKNDQPFKAEKNSKLLDPNTSAKLIDIKKGEAFTILTKTEKELVKIGRSYHCKINYKGKTYLIATSAILKPTGKQVDFIKADLTQKVRGGVFRDFKPGIVHEKNIVMLFINGSGGNWEFEHKGKEYKVEELGDPAWKGRGMPKTDVYVRLDKPISPFGTELKISLKQDNAVFIDSWMLPQRFEALAGKSGAKKIIIDMLKRIQSGDVGVRSPFMYWFVKDRSYNGPELSTKAKYEAGSGEKKFGKSSPAASNCFFKGGVPKDITTLISNLKPIGAAIKTAGYATRGYGADGNGACYKKNDKTGEWDVSPKWKSYFGIK